jgi:subtilisin family serine protease
VKSRQHSFLRSRLLLIGIMAVIVIAAGLYVFGPGAQRPLPPTPTLAPAPQITFTPPPDLKELAQQFPRLERILTNPELDSAYKDFLVAYERGGIEAAELLARQRGLLTGDNQIRITLVLDTEDSAALVTELQNIGVNVRGTYRDLIDISIPLDLIVKTAQSDEPGKVFDQITQLEHVIGLQLPAPKPTNPTGAAAPHQPTTAVVGFFPQVIDPVISEGVKVIGADAWQAAGYTGQGVKVGVLDQGFDGYRDHLGRELPMSVTIESFVPGTNADQTGVTHGTAVAEIVHDVAPGAELYLAYYDGGDVSMGNAVEWLMKQGVQIITHSAGGLAAPMDGTGRDAELVDQATRAGVLWINSAGNSAREHYRGDYTDVNGDQVNEFAPNRPLLSFQSSTAGTTQIILTWNDWAKDGSQDLDLFLLDADGNVLASSRNTREGNHPPIEQILYKFDDSRTYFITIHGVKVDRALQINLFIHETANMELADPIGSLATPGDALGSLTVGAVDWRDNQLEPFSSRGPTADGRTKPDLAGPDGVANAAFAPERFYGTSAAAPHIAGAAALIWGAYPQSTADDIRQYLIGNAIDLTEPGLDSSTGAGLLLLPTPPPAPTPMPPTPTSEPGQSPASPLPTPTLQRIVIAPPGAPRPRPPVVIQSNDNSNWIGLGAIAIAVLVAGVAGAQMARRARAGERMSPRSVVAAQLMPAACPHCGRIHSADAVFCSQCGRPVGAAATITKCSHCGRALRPGAKFCARCGQGV